MKQNKVVLFDIDYTIFNTDAFRTHLYEVLLQKLGYKKADFFSLAKATEKETKVEMGYFKPRTFLKLLHEKTKAVVPVEELEAIYFDESLYEKSLYENARTVFEELAQKRDIDILIFSTGEKEFQMQKIASLKDLLKEEKLRIFGNKIIELAAIFEEYQGYQIYMVDDLPLILKEAKLLNKNSTTILVKRDKIFEGQDVVKNFAPDYEIDNLNDIIPIVVGH